jgi:hypothetical protein
MIYSRFSINEKWGYDILAIIFTFFTLILVTFSLPVREINVAEFINVSRTLLLALGAGYFGLLGFIVAAFTISSSKMIDLINKRKEIIDTKYNDPDYESLVKYELNHTSSRRHANDSFFTYLQSYRSTVRIIIFNIIAIFIVFIITCIPYEFSLLLFWICTFIIVIAFYYSVFYTLKIFSLGLKPVEIEWMSLQMEYEKSITEMKVKINKGDANITV